MINNFNNLGTEMMYLNKVKAENPLTNIVVGGEAFSTFPLTSATK